MSYGQDGLGTERWTLCHWQEIDELPFPRKAGSHHRGVLMLPPPVQDLAFEIGLWDALNNECNLLLDVAEEETISKDRLPGVIEVVSRFASDLTDAEPRVCRVEVGYEEAPRPRPLIAQMTSSDLAQFLRMLASFLSDARSEDKEVVISP